MAIKIITEFRILMQKAYALGQAKKHGDKEEIVKAQTEHNIYRDICLQANRINLGFSQKSLDSRKLRYENGS